MNNDYETKICDFGEAKIMSGLRPSLIGKEFRKLHKQQFPTSSDDESNIDSEDVSAFDGLLERPKDDEDQDIGRSISNTFVGTAYYTAPEMLLNNTSGPFSDLWALGVIIYEMITGEVPWKGNTSPVIFNEILSRDISFPSEMN
jgi:serine/threonine protein kinase